MSGYVIRGPFARAVGAAAVVKNVRRFVEELDDDAAAAAALRVVPFKCMWREVQASAGTASNHFANALVSVYDFSQSARFKEHANDHTPVHPRSQ